MTGLPVLLEQLERRKAADGLVGGQADARFILRALNQVELECLCRVLAQRGLARVELCVLEPGDVAAGAIQAAA